MFPSLFHLSNALPLFANKRQKIRIFISKLWVWVLISKGAKWYKQIRAHITRGLTFGTQYLNAKQHFNAIPVRRFWSEIPAAVRLSLTSSLHSLKLINVSSALSPIAKGIRMLARATDPAMSCWLSGRIVELTVDAVAPDGAAVAQAFTAATNSWLLFAIDWKDCISAVRFASSILRRQCRNRKE